MKDQILEMPISHGKQVYYYHIKLNIIQTHFGFPSRPHVSVESAVHSQFKVFLACNSFPLVARVRAGDSAQLWRNAPDERSLASIWQGLREAFTQRRPPMDVMRGSCVF
jgi:hypothetical protein